MKKVYLEYWIKYKVIRIETNVSKVDITWHCRFFLKNSPNFLIGMLQVAQHLKYLISKQNKKTICQYDTWTTTWI
jgi:hypothetical protein